MQVLEQNDYTYQRQDQKEGVLNEVFEMVPSNSIVRDINHSYHVVARNEREDGGPSIINASLLFPLFFAELYTCITTSILKLNRMCKVVYMSEDKPTIYLNIKVFFYHISGKFLMLYLGGTRNCFLSTVNWNASKGNQTPI